MRYVKILAGVALSTAVLASCSDPSKGTSSGGDNGGGGPSTKGSDTLNMYLYQPPKLFSPFEPLNGPDQLVMSMVFGSLYGVDADYQQQPNLASALPTYSADGKTITIPVRTGTTWSDGKPFGAADVAYTLKTAADAKSGSTYAGVLSNVTSITASGDDVKIVQKSPDAGLVSQIGSMPIVPEHVLSSTPVTKLPTAPFFRNPTVGVGPFTFVSYKTDQYVELKANPKYREPVKIKRVFLKPVTSDVATAQLGTGEMDLVQISPTDLKTVQKMKNVKIASAAGPGYVRIAVNQAKPQFKDPRVRQAFLYAIDRKSLVQKVLAGKGSVINSSFKGDSLPTSGMTDYSYNPDKAKALLKAAHWKAGTTVKLAWVPGQRDRDTAATIVQSQLEAVGVKVQLHQSQSAELVDSYTKKSFDFVLYGGGNYATDSSSVYPITGCNEFYPTGGNLPNFCDKDMDSLMNQAKAVTDKDQRNGLYQKAAKIENKDAAYFWLYDPDTLWAYNTRLTGFEPNGDFANGTNFWNFADWSLG